VAAKGEERGGCLGGAGVVVELLGEAFGGSVGRKLWKVIKVGKCVGCEGVAEGCANCSEYAKENIFS